MFYFSVHGNLFQKGFHVGNNSQLFKRACQLEGNERKFSNLLLFCKKKGQCNETYGKLEENWEGLNCINVIGLIMTNNTKLLVYQEIGR